MPNTYPRPSPYKLGVMAARRGVMLRGMPYGPGKRQDDYIRGALSVSQQPAPEPADNRQDAVTR